MLDLSASAERLAEAKQALTWITRHREALFTDLFDPLGRHRAVYLHDEVIDPLLAIGLVERTNDRVSSMHRVRRIGERFYVMEIGTTEYWQDIWPETDALLGEAMRAPPDTLLDIGTGTGIIAVEAAVRGHRVVATDAFESTLALARFNAALNQVEGIDFRLGHLFEPVAGERFALVLTAPHYTLVYDQLRVEALHRVVEHVADGGRAIVATFLEWEGSDGAMPVVETVLRPLVERGASVTVRPIHSEVKRGWFKRFVSDEPIEGVTSRHRFLVQLTPSGGRLTVERPPAEAQLNERLVPLHRLTAGGREPARAIVSGPRDLDLLVDLMLQLDRGLLTWTCPLPLGIVDACRFGARVCVSAETTHGAASAIPNLRGELRPCTVGGTIARVEDSTAALLAAQRRLAAEAYERRGCAGCSALSWCSRCLFPVFLDEPAYCELMRTLGPRLKWMMRLGSLFDGLAEPAQSARTLQIKSRRTAALLAAEGRPYPSSRSDSRDPGLAAVAARWLAASGWLVTLDRRSYWTFWESEQEGQRVVRLDRGQAAVWELLTDGATAAEIDRYLMSARIASPSAWSFLQQMAAQL